MAQGRRRAALAAGAAAGRGPGGGDSGSQGPKGAQTARGCGSAQGIVFDLRLSVPPSFRLSIPPSFFPISNQHLGSMCSGRGVGATMASKVGTAPHPDKTSPPSGGKTETEPGHAQWREPRIVTRALCHTDRAAGLGVCVCRGWQVVRGAPGTR